MILVKRRFLITIALMKQELDSDQIFDRLDQMLRKNERQQQAEKGGISTDNEVPRIVLTAEMRTDQYGHASKAISLEHISLDDDETERLVAQVYADVNARLDEVITDWIDEALQQRVMALTKKPPVDEPLSH